MQAIIITCYKDKENLIKLIKSFEDKMNIYIHIDKKSKEITEKDIKDLNYKNIVVLKKYSVSWGSYNHLLAVIELLKMAKENKENKYIHIISGQDYRIKPLNYFFDMFDDNDKIYFSLTNYKDFSDNIAARYKKGTFNAKYSEKNLFVKFANKIYGIFRNKNNIGEFTNINKGMIWASMPMEVIDYVLNYIKLNKRFLKDLKHCIIPEEFFFQTIIMNSKYKDNVQPDNLRYTDWNKRNGSCPAYLDKSDFEKVKESNCIFARKIDSKISKDLIELLDKELH